jgi:hypothetical protein
MKKYLMKDYRGYSILIDAAVHEALCYNGNENDETN